MAVASLIAILLVTLDRIARSITMLMWTVSVSGWGDCIGSALDITSGKTAVNTLLASAMTCAATPGARMFRVAITLGLAQRSCIRCDLLPHRHERAAR